MSIVSCETAQSAWVQVTKGSSAYLHCSFTDSLFLVSNQANEIIKI